MALDDGTELDYDDLVVAPGIAPDLDRVPGLAAALDGPHAASNYITQLAPKTWGPDVRAAGRDRCVHHPLRGRGLRRGGLQA
ncbi:hypothetical protein QT756_22505, partial [Xanthomonas citri pv. citri]